ncbi:hypothetical protein M8C21_031845, partial [Ambrosia artemisiifolia]
MSLIFSLVVDDAKLVQICSLQEIRTGALMLQFMKNIGGMCFLHGLFKTMRCVILIMAAAKDPPNLPYEAAFAPGQMPDVDAISHLTLFTSRQQQFLCIKTLFCLHCTHTNKLKKALGAFREAKWSGLPHAKAAILHLTKKKMVRCIMPPVATRTIKGDPISATT